VLGRLDLRFYGAEPVTIAVLVSATLFTIPGCPPAITAKLILAHKGIAYREVVLRHPVHRQLVVLLATPGFKTPSVSTDGRRLHGTLAIAAGLEEIQPDPPLFPDEAQARARVEEIERWSEETLAAVPDQLAPLVSVNGSGPHLNGHLLAGVGERIISVGVPERIVSLGTSPLIWLRDRVAGERVDPRERALAELSAAIDQVDGLIEAGVLGGPDPNAADFHVAPRIRVLMRHAQVRRLIAGSPAVRHALSLCPSWPE
jgi:glutathione S-transferase